jgi:hypothetical protein
MKLSLNEGPPFFEPSARSGSRGLRKGDSSFFAMLFCVTQEPALSPWACQKGLPTLDGTVPGMSFACPSWLRFDAS